MPKKQRIIIIAGPDGAGQEESQGREIQDTLRGLRRATKRALELGLQTALVWTFNPQITQIPGNNLCNLWMKNST